MTARVAVVLLVIVFGLASDAAAKDAPPKELWQEYPLEPKTTTNVSTETPAPSAPFTPPGRGVRTSERPDFSETGGGSVGWLTFALTLAVVAVIVVRQRLVRTSSNATAPPVPSGRRRPDLSLRRLSRGSAAPRTSPHLSGGGAVGVIGAATAATSAGYFLSQGQQAVAVTLVAAPLVAWVLVRPTAPLVLLAASLPAVQSLTGESSQSVALSDVLLVLIGAGLLAQASVTGAAPFLRALRPIASPVVQFCIVVVLLLPFHPGLSELLQTAQRLELLLLPLVVGAFAALSGLHIRMLEAYVVSATALGVIWQLDDLGLQKNPVGQFIAGAVLVVIGIPALRRLLPCLLLLIPTLFLTESRGAILAAGLGLAVLLVLQRSELRTPITRGVPAVVIAVVAFALLPSSIQDRVTTLSSAGDTAAAYSISIREQQADDAREVIAAHPWTGVGIGNYSAGDPALGTQADDPHHVLLLQAAEGGYLLAGSFLVLVTGVLVLLVQARRVVIAPAAAAVLVATVAHGLVDVYWVRGTPVLSWLLVGMTFGLLANPARVQGTT